MPTVAKSKSDSKKVVTVERPLLYEKVTSRICAGDKAITVQQAKELLGWQEETDKVKFGNSYLVQDIKGNKVSCVHNVTNRPIYGNVLKSLIQEHLRRRWRLNGEPIIVGRTGLILNGQHTLISLILAAQEWEEDREKWAAYWTDEPTMEKLIVLGIDECDETVNTMDTCKPRSLFDVICRSSYFAGMGSSERRNCARSLDYAVRLMWHRTGAGLDAFAPRRTHAESMAFVDAHPKLIECVKHIAEEDGDERHISRYCSPGYAAALLYLMGCSKSESDAYREAPHPDESMLDWSRWDDACNFWVLLGGSDESTKPVRVYLTKLLQENRGSNPERWAILIKAWNLHANKKKITEKDLTLSYLDNEDGSKTLDECPTVGGIDLGDPSLIDEDQITTPDPTPEQIKNGAKKIRAKRVALSTKRAGADWAKDDVAIVVDGADQYLATIIDAPYELDNGTSRVMVRDEKGGEWDVDLECLHLTPPVEDDEEDELADETDLVDEDTIDTEVEEPIKPAKQPKQKPTNPSKKGKGKPGQAQVGKVMWVSEKGSEPWRGRVVEINDRANVAKVQVDVGFQGAGLAKIAPLSCLSFNQPKD